MPETVPWSKLGGRRCIAGDRTLAVRTVRDHKNSPSRLRFRPPSRLTFALRLRSPGAASTYLRSVLGAIGNLDGVEEPCKGVQGSSERESPQFAFDSVIHISTAD